MRGHTRMWASGRAGRDQEGATAACPETFATHTRVEPSCPADTGAGLTFLLVFFTEKMPL